MLSLSFLPGFHTPGLAAENPVPAEDGKEKPPSKKELLQTLRENLFDLDDETMLNSLGLKKIKIGNSDDYAFNGKPLDQLDENTLNDLIGKTTQSVNTEDQRERARQEETRKDVERMLENMRNIKEQQDLLRERQNRR